MVFSADDETERLDWFLLQNGAVNLYLRCSLFDDDVKVLKGLGYQIIDLTFSNEKQFHQDISEALKWKQQFGYAPWTGNLDALNEGLMGEMFDTADDTAFCIRNFNGYVSCNDDAATGLLDMLELASRNYLLFGKRLVCLIQTNDPAFHRDGLGGRPTNWNSAEWLHSARGL